VVIYFRIAAKSFQRNLVYRAANLAGILTNTFFGAIYILIYGALFEGRVQVGGYDVRDTVTYAVLAQSLLMVMSAFGSTELSQSIIKGQVAVDMARPIDFYFYWGAMDLGRAIYHLIFRFAPTYIIGALLFGVRPPASLGAVALFFVTMLSGMLLSFGFRFLANSLAFWTTDARGLIALTNTVLLFFSGFIVPINFFPPALQAFTEALPFGGLAQVPINVYLGRLDGVHLLRVMERQALWLIGLFVVGRLLLAQMMRRVTIAGG
jgi:ABC-2 type transport system permease protein